MSTSRTVPSRYLWHAVGLGAAAVAGASTRWTRIAVDPEYAVGLLDPPVVGRFGLGGYVVYVAAGAAVAAVAAAVRPSHRAATVWLGVQGVLLAISLALWVAVTNDVAGINGGPGPDMVSVGAGVYSLLAAAAVGVGAATAARRSVTSPRPAATAPIPTPLPH